MSGTAIIGDAGPHAVFLQSAAVVVEAALGIIGAAVHKNQAAPGICLFEDALCSKVVRPCCPGSGDIFWSSVLLVRAFSPAL